jgi:transposase
MGRKSKYIKNLSEEEKISLHKGYTYGSLALYRRKCHCILLSEKGKDATELSEFFGVSRQSILTWLHLWEQEGQQGLKLKPGRGRKPKLDKDKHVNVIKTLIENEPKNLTRVVAQIESELDIKVSKKTLQRFLKNLNISGNDLENA